jgi:hypothetical protein
VHDHEGSSRDDCGLENPAVAGRPRRALSRSGRSQDVCRLDNDETLAVLRWAAMAILRAALQDAPGSGPDQTSRPERSGRTPS